MDFSTFSFHLCSQLCFFFFSFFIIYFSPRTGYIYSYLFFGETAGASFIWCLYQLLQVNIYSCELSATVKITTVYFYSINNFYYDISLYPYFNHTVNINPLLTWFPYTFSFLWSVVIIVLVYVAPLHFFSWHRDLLKYFNRCWYFFLFFFINVVQIILSFCKLQLFAT